MALECGYLSREGLNDAFKNGRQLCVLLGDGPVTKLSFEKKKLGWRRRRQLGFGVWFEGMLLTVNILLKTFETEKKCNN